MRSIYLRDRKSITDEACGPAIYFVCSHDFIGFLPYKRLFFLYVLKWLRSEKIAGDVGEEENY